MEEWAGATARLHPFERNPMAGKLTIVAAAAAGYVLGARAGRGRYETIRSTAGDVWRNPKVQQAASAAQDLAAEQAVAAKDKVVAEAKKATSGHDV